MEKAVTIKPALPGFTRRQKSALKKAPDEKFVQNRHEGGKELSYLEGWYVIAEANRIFGPENWDRVTLSTQCIWQGKSDGSHVSTYTARVRICIRAGAYTLVREGSGFGQGRGRDPGEAQGWALKTAETDATKRALATMGAPFGLTLYARETEPCPHQAQGSKGDSDKTGSQGLKPSEPIGAGRVLPMAKMTKAWLLFDATGETLAAYHDPVQFCTALRRCIETVSTPNLLESVFASNRRSLARLVMEKPELRSDGDQHYSTILAALYQARLKRLSQEVDKTEHQAQGFPMERQVG